MKSDAPANRHERDERLFERLIQWGVALCIGAMGAFILSLRQVNPVVRFEFDWVTLLGLIVGGAMGWLFWKVIPDEKTAQEGRGRWFPLVIWSLALTGGMVAGFAYGMKDVSGRQHRDMLIGTAAALVVLGGVGFIGWKIARYFEDDHRRFLEDEERERNDNK